MSDEQEQWKPWPRDAAYDVSTLGRVRGPSGRILAQERKVGRKGPSERDRVCVDVRGVRTLVHRMVWQTWCSGEDARLTHIDGDAGNNRPSNLRVYQDPLPVVPASDFPSVLARYDSGERIKDIARGYGVSEQALRNALSRVVCIGDRRAERSGAKAVEMREQAKARSRQKAEARGRPKLCDMTDQQRWEYDRDKGLRLEFGISQAIFRRLVHEQCGKCALCGDPLQSWEWEDVRRFDGTNPVVDHCHRGDGSHAVRGILHSTCNTACGMMRDDPERARRMVRYLVRTREARPLRPSVVQHGLESLYDVPPLSMAGG